MIKRNSLFFWEELDGDVLLVRLAGEIDHHGAVGVRSDIDDLLISKRPKKLILDLSEVGFMDSSGLGLIMGRYSLIKELGGSIVLREPTPQIVKILELAGMERIIKIEEGERKK